MSTARSLFAVLAALSCLACVGDVYGSPATDADKAGDGVAIQVVIPSLETDNATVNEAFRIAIGDLLGNVSTRKYEYRGLSPAIPNLYPSPTVPRILAGLHYGTPWTRDAAINAWNGASLIMPAVSATTLLSVLEPVDGDDRLLFDRLDIGGQYWDAMIWATGAWNQYLYTGDTQVPLVSDATRKKRFLLLAFDATSNSLERLEEEEFDAKTGLFRGPGWSDGVAGYPDKYADTGGSSSILDWPKHNPTKVSKPGYGIPMMALSTNCIYYNAYVTVEKMKAELKAELKDVPKDYYDRSWPKKAAALKKAINKHFWNEEKGNYRYLVGPLGKCDHQEGIGSAYAILFGVADARQTEAIFKSQHITPAGIPCGWPNFKRYKSKDGQSFGRHIGVVWPQVQGFWADAAARAGKADIFGHELLNLAAHAVRDKQFAEIYHPLSGAIYGGLQENGQGIALWNATSRQTWSATAFIRMVFMGLAGMRFDTDGVRFQPCLPKGVGNVHLANIRYRKIAIDITVQGSGSKIKKSSINGKDVTDCFLPADGEGRKVLSIVVGDK
jgi:hypothetical protein